MTKNNHLPAVRHDRPPAGTSWSDTRWRLLESAARPGARNMAVDAVLAESVRGGGPPTLRFYRWWPPCISFGRNQEAEGHYDTVEAERRGIEFVRRPTGGRSVYHHHEVTYSLVVGERLLGGPRKTYELAHRALLTGLSLLEVSAEIADHPGRARRPSTVPCFSDVDGGAIVADERKLVGSAQLRERGVILQHGSILLSGDQSPTSELLNVQRAEEHEWQPTALDELMSRLPTWAELVDALAAGFERELGIELEGSQLADEEKARLMRHVRRFSDPAWTWRL